MKSSTSSGSSKGDAPQARTAIEWTAPQAPVPPTPVPRVATLDLLKEHHRPRQTTPPPGLATTPTKSPTRDHGLLPPPTQGRPDTSRERERGHSSHPSSSHRSRSGEGRDRTKEDHRTREDNRARDDDHAWNGSRSKDNRSRSRTTYQDSHGKDEGQRKSKGNNLNGEHNGH
jgi:hypothetical protein